MTEIIPFKKATLLQEKEATAAEIISKSRWPITGALVLSLIVHFLFFGDYYLTYDDAYVFHVYARNLAQGHGFSFNPGEISHAATPLLTFVLAVQHFLFQDSALVTAKFVNLGFSLGATILAFLDRVQNHIEYLYRICVCTSLGCVTSGKHLECRTARLHTIYFSAADFALFLFVSYTLCLDLCIPRSCNSYTI